MCLHTEKVWGIMLSKLIQLICLEGGTDLSINCINYHIELKTNSQAFFSDFYLYI